MSSNSPILGGASAPSVVLDTTARKCLLEAVVEKRTMNFHYLRTVHNGDTFWLNCALISKERLAMYVNDEVPKQRTVQFFHLGLSLAKLIDKPPDIHLVRALAQLFEEFEYHYANQAVQGMKYMMAKPVDVLYPELCPEPETDPVAPRIYRFGNEVVYENFLAPPVPFPLNYLEVLDSLCNILSRLYYRLLDEGIWGNPLAYDALCKVDAKVKHHIINPVARELTELSAGVCKQECDWLRQDIRI